MKKDIHPKYYKDAITHCSCGKVFKVGSTKQEMHVEICSACHPFYTGQDKIIDTAGRVEKFRKRLAQKKETKKGTPKRGKKVPPVGGIPPDGGKKQNDRKPQ